MKDSKGHGSNTGTKGMRLIKTHTLGPHTAKVYNNPDMGRARRQVFPERHLSAEGRLPHGR
jgi:hypothetical protein